MEVQKKGDFSHVREKSNTISIKHKYTNSDIFLSDPAIKALTPSPSTKFLDWKSHIFSQILQQSC